ncbi:MAG: MFS transporter [Acidimicrobiales bacterium]
MDAERPRAGTDGGEVPSRAPTVPVGGTDVPIDPEDAVKVFGSRSFRRLWFAQLASSLGDWVGIIAIIALAARIQGGSSPEAAIGLVLSARMVPGFFLGPVAGVLVDRLDRKRVMVVCDIGRGLVLATLPWVDTVFGLVLASLVLEVLTQLWAPAKEASVPNLVPTSRLPTANSLSLAAAYGTFPVGSALFAGLAGVAVWLGGEHGTGLFAEQENLAIFVDVLTFFISALLISRLALPRGDRQVKHDDVGAIGSSLRDLREGFRFITQSRLVRAVMLAIATGLIGGGMLVPLGPPFAERVLGGGSAAFGLLLTALGSGVAVGVIGLSVFQSRLPAPQVFVFSVFGAGVCIISGAAMTSLRGAIVFVALLGVFAGSVYVVGFTILQTSVADEMRGRIFATLFTVVRFCLLLAFTVAPFLSTFLDRMSKRFFDRSVTVLGADVALPGTRLTLWLGGLIILAAGAVALLAFRGGRTAETSPA